jgi:hypothetical protein
MSEPEIVGIRQFPSGSFYLFSHAIFDLLSHPRHETISLA